MPSSIRPRSENQLLGAFIYELGFRDSEAGRRRTGIGLNIYSALDTGAGDLTLATDFVVLIEFKLRRSGAADEWDKSVRDGAGGRRPGPKQHLLRQIMKEGLGATKKKARLSRKGHFLAYGSHRADAATHDGASYTLDFETYLDVVFG